MDTNDPLLLSELRRDEDVRYVPYLDSLGIQTVGVGHNMVAKPLPDDWTFPLTEDQVNQLLEQDLQTTFNELDAHVPWWRDMSYVRQRVIANMCFNLGWTRLSGFVNTLSFMQNGQYQNAAAGMLASKWATQVHARADRLADMMKAG